MRIYPSLNKSLKKNLHKILDSTNLVFVLILLPYFILCLTIGGAHESIFDVRHCENPRQSCNDSHGLHICAGEGKEIHSAETCQICKWLKTPSTQIKLQSTKAYFNWINDNVICYSNPELASLSIHKFTIRPPPLLTFGV
jgi:hypothetical protein